MLKFCSTARVNLYHEIRSVAREVGGFEQAWRMSTELRRWWLEQMQKEKERIAAEANSRPR